MVWKLFSEFWSSLSKERKQLYAERFIFVKNLIVFTIGYGLILNFALWQIFHLPFTWISWIGWGFAFWFIREELPVITRRILSK